MKKVAIILSGCGVYDGSEIHEAVLTLLHLEKSEASYQCFAPDIEQHHVINHLTGEETSGVTRNVLVEAARIARGNVKPLTELQADDFDALILPGGFGAAKNLCNFAVKGAECEIHEDVLQACKQFADAKKPAGYICISPVMIPHIYGKNTSLTIGIDRDTAAAVQAMGGDHVDSTVSQIVVDEEHKVVSTPAYMLAGSIVEANSGIEKLVAKVLELAK
ncbi:isoprenoid biosynthesis glyoxalase ElbB [Flocculibacter collagenilyticus]|uniref:isoprenoid biosynthesis glyoxalase ElbB n=1 Tax=Flocculibacter collagenilyticus TaxID=2744479 RepID=UPI0018F497B9|nr:isoprenoid biosynthesis glyoxalase ElbB [Flocculibacter collagenilyticus]